uniref:Nonsense-mediated mRNA decay factor SMG8 n=1 Tax=Caenorhabditis tropicalis TaxID=1561998 RepID=A0A1I7UF59_9PELO
MDISEWIKQSKEIHNAHLDTKIKVIGIIGKDYPDHGKGDNINSYLRENVFAVASSEKEACTIQAHFSEDEQILFLVMNGVDDVSNIRKCLLTPEKSVNNYFDAMAESELKQQRMLHFLFISCHFIIIFEQTSRIDLDFIRILKKVNVTRIQLRKKVNQRLISDGLREIQFNNRLLSPNESEGRMVIPRVLIAFQRNNIRSDVNTSKKHLQRELYEKLEKSLDNQFTDILKLFDLIDSGSSSLCQLNETIPCVHLLNPKIVKRDIVTEMFESLMAEIENKTNTTPHLASNNSFVKFLEDNFRSEKNEISLEKVIDLMTTLQCILDGSIEESPSSTQMQNFIRRIETDHLEEARRLYTNETRPASKELRRGGYLLEKESAETVKIRSKEEHMMRFSDATHYIESVVGINSKQVLSDMQSKCNELWQSDMRACESISMMGHPCIRKVHPTYGDQTTPESRWTPHDASNTLVSTCICGRKQLIRKEPFSVKEANFDFYENPEFKCCKRLWRFQFQLYQEDGDDKDFQDIMWADRESNSLRAAKKLAQQEDDLADAMDDLLSLQEESTSTAEETDSDLDDIQIGSEDSLSGSLESSGSEMYVRPSSKYEEPSKTERELAVEHAKRLQKLENSGKTDEFLMTVPNSMSPGKLPLFPSFYLCSLGDSSVYSHGNGLKSQPNFKLGGDYLSPAIVFLNVASDVWNRDLNKIRSEDFSRKCGKETKDDVARVKLFVGFEYECSRGHRFFVDYAGEPLIYPKGSNVVRESTHRASLGDVLQADLPIRRPCTCRKAPLKSAQLQKIHVVTPKAPVHITIDPKILIPGHEGVYGTGQEPLELHHSKYYILHLPVVYSSPSSGTWMPEEYNPDREGTLLGGAIKVVYKPVLSFRW